MPWRRSHEWMRYAPNWLLLAGAVYPLLWLNAFALFVIRARLILGRWPSPYNPDPKDLGMDLHYHGLLLGGVLLVTCGAGTLLAADLVVMLVYDAACAVVVVTGFPFLIIN